MAMNGSGILDFAETTAGNWPENANAGNLSLMFQRSYTATAQLRILPGGIAIDYQW